MLCSLSNKLKEDSLKSIQNLEKEIGKTLLAFNCHDVKPSVLTENELAKIQKLEKNLSVALVAVDA
jgi:hypothetical protein